jgi:hypothetical protein
MFEEIAMFLDIREVIFLFTFVTILLLVLIYLQICDIVVGRYAFKIFSKYLQFNY